MSRRRCSSEPASVGAEPWAGWSLGERAGKEEREEAGAETKDEEEEEEELGPSWKDVWGKGRACRRMMLVSNDDADDNADDDDDDDDDVEAGAEVKEELEEDDDEATLLLLAVTLAVTFETGGGGEVSNFEPEVELSGKATAVGRVSDLIGGRNTGLFATDTTTGMRFGDDEDKDDEDEDEDEEARPATERRVERLPNSARGVLDKAATAVAAVAARGKSSTSTATKARGDETEIPPPDCRPDTDLRLE